MDVEPMDHAAPPPPGGAAVRRGLDRRRWGNDPRVVVEATCDHHHGTPTARTSGEIRGSLRRSLRRLDGWRFPDLGSSRAWRVGSPALEAGASRWDHSEQPARRVSLALVALHCVASAAAVDRACGNGHRGRWVSATWLPADSLAWVPRAPTRRKVTWLAALAVTFRRVGVEREGLDQRRKARRSALCAAAAGLPALVPPTGFEPALPP